MSSIGCPSRCHLVLTNFFAIQVKLIQAKGCGKGIGFFYIFFDFKGSSYIGSFGNVLIGIVSFGGYKRSFPCWCAFLPLTIFSCKGSYKRCGFAPVRFFLTITGFCTDKIALAALQRSTFCINMCRFLRLCFSAVIDQICKISVFCNLKFVGFLFYIFLIAYKLPGKLGHVGNTNRGCFIIHIYFFNRKHFLSPFQRFLKFKICLASSGVAGSRPIARIRFTSFSTTCQLYSASTPSAR